LSNSPSFFLSFFLSFSLLLFSLSSSDFFYQSVVSSKFQVDIHPGAEIGGGVYLMAGAGVVIGETAVVGDDCSILQGVTLGGTGKVSLAERARSSARTGACREW